MVEIFKTNVDSDAAQELLLQLQHHFPTCKINFDLEDCDRILRIEGTDFSVGAVSDILLYHRFVCELLA